MRKNPLFTRTKWLLATFNTAIILLLLAALAIVVYVYTDRQLYADVERSLYATVDGVEGDLDNVRNPRDLRVALLIWNEDRDQLLYAPEQERLTEQVSRFIPRELNRIQETEAEDEFHYTTLSVEVQNGDNTYIVQALRNTTSEHEFLERLIVILAVTFGAGGLAAIALGIWMANRALIPIQRSWQRQQEFVSDAAHELRTPLAVLTLKTDELFQDADATIMDKAHEISVISSEIRRLSKLSANLLLLAKSDSSQLELNRQPTNVSSLLTEVEELFSPMAEIEQRSLTFTIDPDLELNVDPDRIKQLLVILLDNAFAFTSPGDTISVRFTDPAQPTLIVEDTGIGMTKADQQKIFNRFFQAEASREKKTGAGLGLSIAKWIVDAHNASILVDSAEGKGTRFTITF